MQRTSIFKKSGYENSLVHCYRNSLMQTHISFLFSLSQKSLLIIHDSLQGHGGTTLLERGGKTEISLNENTADHST